MTAINLPSLSFNIDESSDKETLNNILDTLQLYRKELNFLLMNLDEDNMPSVIGRIEDGEGNISNISQTVDEISMTVANSAGDISNLQITANQISAKVADAQGNIAALELTASGLSSTVASHTGQISQINQTASGIQTQVSNQAGQISSLNQTATSIQTQVTNQAGEISTIKQTAQGIQTQVTNNAGNISTLTQTAQGLQSQVTSVVRDVNNLDSEVGTLSSSVTQMAGQISSKVSYTDYTGREIASLINQDAYRISISAEALDLTGITTIYGRYTSDYAKFDGSDFGVFNGNTQRFVIGARSYGTGIYLHDGMLLSAADGDTYFQRPITMHSNPTGSREGYNITSTTESGRCYIDATSSGVVVRDSYGSVLGSLFFG